MTTTVRVYLDHAATSWPKSEGVLEAMNEFARRCGAAAGRGGYRSAAEADQRVSAVRRSIARLIDAPASECISFHSNGTTALNAAIFGLVRSGDHVLVSAAEHNSVLRPLYHLSQTQQVRLTIVPTDKSGRVDAAELISAVEPTTRLVALTHASNVTGTVQPVEEVGRYLRDHPARFLCDAAQTFGTLPLSVQAAGIDLLAAPGHKSSGGPLGTAFLYLSPELHTQILPMLHGGTGSQSESLEMPRGMPSKMEAGNLNVPAIVGWGVALDLWSDPGDATRRKEHARKLASRLHAGLAKLPHVNVHGTPGAIPIASVTLDSLSPGDAANILDAEFGIETRSGLHCAALIHRFLETEPEGTLRISAGNSSTEAEIDAVIEALEVMVSAMHSGGGA